MDSTRRAFLALLRALAPPAWTAGAPAHGPALLQQRRGPALQRRRRAAARAAERHMRRIALWLALAALGAAPAGAGDKPDAPATASAVFAGGCFWCMEPPFEALSGVVS